jgi:hypothetical protein
MSFQKWIETKHPDFYDEGFKDLAKKAVIGAALAGAAMGAGKAVLNDPAPKNLIQMRADGKKNQDLKDRMLKSSNPKEMMNQR